MTNALPIIARPYAPVGSKRCSAKTEGCRGVVKKRSGAEVAKRPHTYLSTTDLADRWGYSSPHAFYERIGYRVKATSVPASPLKPLRRRARTAVPRS